MEARKNSVRVGVTMRSGRTEHGEVRDCLARDWGEFLAVALPECPWLPVPNLGSGVISFAEAWGLRAVLLSGGNDLGEDPVRDETERTLIGWAQERGVPVFGVSRGLQVLQSYFGGKVRPMPGEDHAGTTHVVRLSGVAPAGEREGEVLVNSFHRNGVRRDEVASPLRTFAVSLDGWVEGLSHPGHRMAAVMWHPERGRPFSEFDCNLVSRVVNGGAW